MYLKDVSTLPNAQTEKQQLQYQLQCHKLPFLTIFTDHFIIHACQAEKNKNIQGKKLTIS